jgi:endonuclease/exonuclease/phosphatase family metal-dependent hydrolase
LGGDFNVRKLALAGLARVASHDVDQIFVAGLAPVGEARVLDRGTLSDHAPVALTLTVAA